MPVAPMGQIYMLIDYISPQQKAVACPNQDVVYGIGFFAPDKQPAVVQVPDFGNRFLVHGLSDVRTDALAQIRKPYGTKPGFYLIAGRKWEGKIPDGIAGVARCSTDLANVIPRVFMDDTDQDRKAIQSIINQVVAYPLSEFGGKSKSKDWRRSPVFPMPESHAQSEMSWVVPEKFFDQLPEVMQQVQPLPGEEALYAWISSVLEAAAKDPEKKKALHKAAVSAEKDLISPLLELRYNGKPAGNVWNSPSNNAQWGTDYFNRTAVAKSNIFENRSLETKYLFTDRDGQGQQLDWKHLYEITFTSKQLPPIKGSWSLTLYNERHFFHPNELNRYSLGTKNKPLQFNPDGSLTLCAGQRSPGKDKESNWLATVPVKGYFVVLRLYGPTEAAINKSWKPSDIEVVK